MSEQATNAPPIIEELRCPACGGLNRAGAQWCGQCLERFAPPAPSEVDAPRSDWTGVGVTRGAEPGAPPPPPVPGATVTASAGAFTVSSDGITWTCEQCDTVNSLDGEVCSVCGTSFAELLRPPEPDRPKRDPNTVALVSLFFPGAGHGYLGLWGQALARGIVGLWVAAVTIISGVQGGVGMMTALFGVIAFALWLIAAHDSYREACGAGGLVILKQKYFLWVVLGILMLMMAMLVMQGLQASAASG